MFTSLIPWGRPRGGVPAARSDRPFASLQYEVNRLFDELWRDFDLPTLGDYAPAVDVRETDTEVHVEVELPGLEEKDCEVTVERDVLTIRGEKHAEREAKKRGYQWSERAYGTFQRAIGFPAEVQADAAHATYKNGVLSVVLPKTPEAQRRARKIAVKVS
jgi:HSP20 family protein